MRLNQFIAHAGVCSRRKADDLIMRGAININGVVVKSPGIQVQVEDCVTYKGKHLRVSKKVYLLLNKPMNCVTTLYDPQKRSTIMDYFPPNLPRVYPIGRLDRNTKGALLITNDGYLARALSHPSQGVNKVYQITLKKKLTTAELAQIRQGILLEDGIARVVPSRH